MSKIDRRKAQVKTGTSYPAPYNMPCGKNHMVMLARSNGITQFGVNEVTLTPGAWSSQRHWHSHEDEFVYMLRGELVLVMNDKEVVLRSGDSAAFPAGEKNAHHLQNRSKTDAVFLAVGTAWDHDHCHYPDADLDLPPGHARDGVVRYLRKDGTAYQPERYSDV